MTLFPRRLALVAALAIAALPAFARAADQHARWGLYAQLASGGAWVSKLSSGDTSLARYTWVRPGEVLRAEHRLAGTPFVTIETITPGPGADKLTISTKENDRDQPTASVVTLRPDGSAVEIFVGRNGNPERATYGPMGEGVYRARTEAQIGGAWREVWSSEITRLKE